MPTSSQAMILRGTESSRSQPPAVNYNCITFGSVQPTYQDFNVKFSPPNSKGRCERVQFDFSVVSSPDRSIDGFEGVFAYNQKTNSYHWQIYSVSPRDGNEIPKDNYDKGDHLDEENCESNYILQQSSEYGGHFTSPSDSLVDFKDAQQAITHIEESYPIDEAAYRRLEELGFRKRNTRIPGRSLVRMSKEEPIPLPKTPQRCSSETLAFKRVPKLSVNNLEKDASLNTRTSASDYSFKPKPLVCENSMRKRRVQPTKQKSLLEKVKESVNWANRVTPSTHHIAGFTGDIHFAACFSLRDSWKYDHVQVKDLVETQTQCQVTSLHFDPVSLRTADRSVLDRWIVTFNSSRNCTRAMERGLVVGGEKLVLRACEDIVREEQDEDFSHPCNFRLPTGKHNRVLRNFLQVH